MHLVITWCGFVGAWLLVAGPIYQAAVELDEIDMDREALRRAGESVAQPARVSPWWWLIPPVGYWKQHRRAQAYRESVMASLKPEHIAQWVQFTSKASGWLFVAGGAFFIAIKET